LLGTDLLFHHAGGPAQNVRATNQQARIDVDRRMDRGPAQGEIPEFDRVQIEERAGQPEVAGALHATFQAHNHLPARWPLPTEARRVPVYFGTRIDKWPGAQAQPTGKFPIVYAVLCITDKATRRQGDKV